ncbi:tRNA 2-thiouridine(34) synthase MnmA [Treponema socranskii]|uniref:tRNA 2-thiouridine(34) synthase MnmA n=1 Tax=Treponema socranskii TaxID=53419 RepID=UPI003D8B1304
MNFIMQKLPEAGDTVVVGLSGGVDSTVTALLLKQKGCRVIGVTMSPGMGGLPEFSGGKKLRSSCYGTDKSEDIAECEKFCNENGIPYRVIDVKDEYQKQVIDYFKSEYRAGRTPNPCIRCNRFIKFGALLEGVQKQGIAYDYFCTGHYARIVKPEAGLWHTDAKPAMIATALDSAKDQTYFLYRIPSATLDRVRFPLAEIEKKDVFRIAKENRLAASEKDESQDFISPEYFDALFSDKESLPGDIIDLDGRVLGRHRGIEHYTIGQRRGLGVSSGKPLYVHSIDAKNNLVILSRSEDLDARSLIADDFVWPGDVVPDVPFDAFVKIRFASRPIRARVAPYAAQTGESFSGKPYRISFAENAHAAAPGQSAVLYIDGVIAGGGIIRRADKDA